MAEQASAGAAILSNTRPWRREVAFCPLLTLDLQVSPTQVIQAHTVMQSLVQDFGDKPVLMIGGPEGVPGASRAVMEG